jgi:hypothetical protein
MSKPPKMSDPSEITHVRCLAAMTDRSGEVRRAPNRAAAHSIADLEGSKFLEVRYGTV